MPLDPLVRNAIAAQSSPALHAAICTIKTALANVDCNQLGQIVDHDTFEASRSAIVTALNNGVSAVNAVANPFGA